MPKLHQLAFAIVALSLAACGSPFTFAKRAQPSALAGITCLQLQELTYDGLLIGEKSEEQYLDEKRAKKGDKADDFVDKWEDNKQVWRTDMKSIIGLTLKGAGIETASFEPGAAPSEGLVVRVNIDAIEPGFYVGVASRPSVTQARLEIYDAARPDELLYAATTKASHSGYSTGGRVREDMLALANRIGDFLASEARSK